MSVVRSMTGFGEGRAVKDGAFEVRVIMRSINHRHSELQLRLPAELTAQEPVIRRHLGRKARRGKLEISIRLIREAGKTELPTINRELAAGLLAAASELGDTLGVDGALDLGILLRLPGVVQQESSTAEFDTDDLSVVLQALDLGMASLEQTKSVEGEALAADLLKRFDTLAQHLGQLKTMAGEVSGQILERLRQRLAELDAEIDIDQERLMQEVILYADRGDVTEELVRLESHFQAFRQALEGGSPSGRRLEFLLQEIHREVNTAGSKVRMPELSALVIEMKSDLEKVREQVLNLE